MMRNQYKRRALRPLLAMGAACAMALASRAQGQSNAPPVGEVEAVRAAAREYLTAWQRGDAAKLRTLWAADGDYVDAAGQLMKAQELIDQARPVDAVAGSSGVAAVTTSTLRFPAPGIAIEDGSTASEEGVNDESSPGRFTAIWVKQDGRWLLSALREFAAIAPEGHLKLQDLAWLVGEWTGTSDDATILISWNWSDGGNYLVGEYVIYRDGRAAAGGSQRIGWDPLAGQIKSWIFDSQGVSGEGRWSSDGRRWLVEATHVTADGKRAKSSAIYAAGEDDTMIWEVTGDWHASGAGAADSKLPPHRVEFRRAVADE
jgi:uncharacterized protein (TIGR02246 family)